LANEIFDLVKKSKSNEGLIVLEGHQDGLISYGMNCKRSFEICKNFYFDFTKNLNKICFE
jgi:hypothetical protein